MRRLIELRFGKRLKKLGKTNYEFIINIFIRKKNESRYARLFFHMWRDKNAFEHEAWMASF